MPLVGLLGVGLVLRLPLLVRHAVDELARLGIRERHTALLGGRAVPLRQAVATEARELHDVEVLDIRALLKMLDQPAERGSLDLGAGRFWNVAGHGRWIARGIRAG